jgi:(1->4)-alpha-D-glucan 1-alpha-D-glucosylmutase
MRLSLLSEMPLEWQEAVARWSARNAQYKTKDCPNANTEYLLYQTMLGAWPIGIDRLWPFMEKAVREAKRKTSWLAPNEPFESATRRFIESLYADEEFLHDVERFVEPLIEPGRVNSLALTLLKLTSPGIPDFYQGSELWDLSLVDPDNRRPVDYALRRRLLCQMQHLNVEQVWSRIDEGLPKLWTIHHGLRVRREYPRCFDQTAKYTPLTASGSKAAHALAYLRGDDVLVLVPRLVLKLAGDWADTTLSVPPGTWRDELSGAPVSGGSTAVADLLEAFPAALLIKQ